MKTKFLTSIFICVFTCVNLWAQKLVTPDVDGLNLHLSSYRDLDAAEKQLLSAGYTKTVWPIAKGMGNLKNTAFRVVMQDSTEKILEIVHSDDKRVFMANQYIGFAAKKWAGFSDVQKANVLTGAFTSIRDLINREYGTSEKGQAKVWGSYKNSDYNLPAILLRGMEEGDLGYFANWGPFGNYPVALASYNSQYVKVTVTDPEALSKFFVGQKK